MKTQIKQDGYKVTISYDDAFMNERVTRSFFTRGAYVYEYAQSMAEDYEKRSIASMYEGLEARAK